MSENGRFVLKPASLPCLSTGELKDWNGWSSFTGAKRLEPHSSSCSHPTACSYSTDTTRRKHYKLYNPVLGWTCSLTLPRRELLVTAPAAGLEPVQAGDKRVQHPIPNPLSHESPKSLIVWRPDAMPGTIGTANPPCLPWFRCIH